MTSKKEFLTPEGLIKLEEELEQLKTVKRREIANKIKEALDHGDISENSEYDQAKEEQAQIEDRIYKLEATVRNAEIIDKDNVRKDRVDIGSTVIIKDMELNEETKYTIVGSAEADPFEGLISNESPIGTALLDNKPGDIVDVQVPDGIIQYEIIEIE